MKVFSWDAVLGGEINLEESFKDNDRLFALSKNGSALTIGAFDGPHLGHKKIFSSVLSESKLLHGVVTFSKPPRAVKEGTDFAGSLSSLHQRLKRFADFGFDFVILIDFSLDFGKMSGRAFLDVLRTCLKMRFLAVGTNFRCGYQIDTGAEELSAYAAEKKITLELVPEFCIAEQHVSSSRIRNYIKKAEFGFAKDCLGYPYSIDCSSFEVIGIESENVFEKVIKLKPQSGFAQIMPPVGLYNACIEVVFCDSDSKGEPEINSFAGSCEVNPTFLSCRFSSQVACQKVQAISFNVF